MQTSTLYKGLAGAALALSFGVAAHAAPSVPVFTADPGAFGSPRAQFQASFIAGDSSSLLTLHADDKTVTGTGFINFVAFSNNASQLSANRTGLGVDYSLWVTFEYTTSLISGTYGQAGSLYDITDLSYTLWGVAGDVSEMFGAPNAASGTAPTAPTGVGEMQLGTGVLFPDGPKAASFTIGGGAAINSATTFEITPQGSDFFVDPSPFYDLAFNQFNNTAPGLERVGNFISLVSATGGVDFNYDAAAVPEPVSLALFGLGLLGIGAAARRRNA